MIGWGVVCGEIDKWLRYIDHWLPLSTGEHNPVYENLLLLYHKWCSNYILRQCDSVDSQLKFSCEERPPFQLHQLPPIWNRNFRNFDSGFKKF